MSLENSYFLTNFILQSQASGKGDQHHDHTQSNCRDGNFYYWSGYATFIFFSRPKPSGYKQFVIQSDGINVGIQKYT